MAAAAPLKGQFFNGVFLMLVSASANSAAPEKTLVTSQCPITVRGVNPNASRWYFEQSHQAIILSLFHENPAVHVGFNYNTKYMRSFI